jgi:ribosomal protein L7/L12
MTSDKIPDDVLLAIGRGDVIEAIKLLRAATGLGLKEAKDLVDAHRSGKTVSVVLLAHSESLPASGPLPQPVMQALRNGNKIEAIKLLREETGLGLKEAKDAVEALHPLQPGTGMGISRGGSGAGSAIWWVSAMVVIAIIAYYFRNSI